MEQISKLLSALSPDQIGSIQETITSYKMDLSGSDNNQDDRDEIIWCDQVISSCQEAITSKE